MSTPLAKKVFELFGTPAAVTETKQVEAPASWPCPHCGTPAEIEAVEPSRDGERMLTYWNCQRCQIWAVTPATIREPPSGWVSKREQ